MSLTEIKQFSIESDTLALVSEQLLHDVVNRIMMGACEFINFQ